MHPARAKAVAKSTPSAISSPPPVSPFSHSLLCPACPAPLLSALPSNLFSSVLAPSSVFADYSPHRCGSSVLSYNNLFFKLINEVDFLFSFFFFFLFNPLLLKAFSCSILLFPSSWIYISVTDNKLQWKYCSVFPGTNQGGLFGSKKPGQLLRGINPAGGVSCTAQSCLVEGEHQIPWSLSFPHQQGLNPALLNI